MCGGNSSGSGHVAASCEHCDGIRFPQEGGLFVDQLGDCQLVKDFIAWIYILPSANTNNSAHMCSMQCMQMLMFKVSSLSD